ncbi:ABC transporter ATP-binding protein [Microtetraspora sp. AC03309]|uniref:ABC transporter ATP-binding protein n=1 Tax=Microtetraspora sp. AC03309 TaxID=2779376 RepID=UPI001E2AF21C|nr:ABC transporter ATP-binding protein [Microtetraspora sp. AC03309]MCC5581934.1 ABC transporter ATP-binding protein [Microtetraspora sp. AC03309]
MEAADRLVVRTIRHGGPWLFVLAVASVGGSILELALPYVIGRTVDGLTAGGAAGPPSGSFTDSLTASLTTSLTGCVLVLAGVVACDSLRVWAAGATSAHASAWLRRRITRHVLGAGPAMTRRFPEGDLTTRLGMNAEETGRAPEAVITGASLLVPTAGGLVALTLIDPVLTLTLVAGLVVILLVLRAFLRDTTAVVAAYQEVQGGIAARLVTALSGARTIAAAGTTDGEIARVLAPLPRLRAYGMDLWRANARAGVQTGVVVPLLEVAVLVVGGLRLAGGDLTVGELYAAARYVVLGAGLGSALGYIGRLARARSAAGRVGELSEEPPLPYGARELPPGPGTLEFRSVAANGLRDLDVVIPGGSAIAVVGRSGSGKSALAALAGRLADPSEGSVLLDGVPVRELSRTALRRAVGYAFERPVLVGDTIGDAIALGLGIRPARASTPSAPTSAPTSAPAASVSVLAATRAACADEFVRRLPQGYGTPLRDAPMSGGERQRVGLARAFAQGTRLLVLDDATSSLDTLTERQVSAALTGELGGRTRLVVAHRVATAARADAVLWLEDGRLRGFDRHEVLWSAHPGYRAVFQAHVSEPAPHSIADHIQAPHSVTDHTRSRARASEPAPHSALATGPTPNSPQVRVPDTATEWAERSGAEHS